VPRFRLFEGVVESSEEKSASENTKEGAEEAEKERGSKAKGEMADEERQKRRQKKCAKKKTENGTGGVMPTRCNPSSRSEKSIGCRRSHSKWSTISHSKRKGQNSSAKRVRMIQTGLIAVGD